MEQPNAKMPATLRRLSFFGALALLCACFALVACARNSSNDTQSADASATTATPQRVAETPNPLELPAETVLTPEELEAYGVDNCFAVSEINDDVFARMQGKSYKEGCPVPREDLRYVRALHVNENGETLTGEMVLNAAIADEVCDIFRQLYDAGYPIERMRLVDDYDADDVASMQDNNSSSFNYRPIET